MSLRKFDWIAERERERKEEETHNVIPRENSNSPRSQILSFPPIFVQTLYNSDYISSLEF